MALVFISGVTGYGMIDFNHWDFAGTFTAVQAALLKTKTLSLPVDDYFSGHFVVQKSIVEKTIQEGS